MWRTSSYTGGGNGGGNCVEVAWRTSSHSNGSGGGSCVETAAHCGRFHVRDSKDREGPQLAFSRECWTAFLGAVRAEER